MKCMCRNGNGIFIGDSATTSHMTRDTTRLYNLQKISSSVLIGNGQNIRCNLEGLLDVICVKRDGSNAKDTREIKVVPQLNQYFNRSLLPSGGLMADVPCLDHSLDGCIGYPDDVQTTKHARRMHARSRCARTFFGTHMSPFGASSTRF